MGRVGSMALAMVAVLGSMFAVFVLSGSPVGGTLIFLLVLAVLTIIAEVYGL